MTIYYTVQTIHMLSLNAIITSMQLLVTSIVIVQLLVFTQAASETHYIGAVVEFAPTIKNVSDNVARFQEFIEEAKKKDADIIVFPEIGMNGYGETDDMLTQVPDPHDKDCPCTNPTEAYTDAFKSISCVARDQQIYVVVNIAEKLPCSGADCLRGYLRYNTNVVFDRKGVVIARYRKYNLFGEPGTNITSLPELSTFETDFGVTFGQFICFDMLFRAPAAMLVQDGIKHIIFSTAWFSELPFLTAVQTQQGFSYGENVTLLASGYNDPTVGSGGSGIYVGGVTLARTFPDEQTSQLLVAEIPKNGTSRPSKPRRDFQPKSTGIYLKREDLAAFASAPLETLKAGSPLCHNEFCCNFSVEMTEPTEEVSYRYRGLAFDGVRDFNGEGTGGMQICAITACDNDNVTSCGTRISPKHSFTAININGTFRSDKTIQIPTTLVNEDQLLPLDRGQFAFVSDCENSECSVSMTLFQPQTNLLTFGILGRDFTKDGEKPTRPPSNGSARSLLSTICVMIMTLAVMNN